MPDISFLQLSFMAWLLISFCRRVADKPDHLGLKIAMGTANIVFAVMTIISLTYFFSYVEFYEGTWKTNLIIALGQAFALPLFLIHAGFRQLMSVVGMKGWF